MQFWKRDCKTLNNAKNHCPNLYKKANPTLKYYIIKFSCIHGAQKFLPKKASNCKQRLRENTFKQGCPAQINISLSGDGKLLIVKSIIADHNHEIPTI